VLSDCTGATDAGNHAAAPKMVTMQRSVFGAAAPSGALLAALGTTQRTGAQHRRCGRVLTTCDVCGVWRYSRR
jgi:hypothetical protein